jgi:hypothetical protein
MDRIRREAANLEKRASFLRLNQEQVTLEKEKADLEDQIDDAEDLQIPTEEEICLILEVPPVLSGRLCGVFQSSLTFCIILLVERMSRGREGL